MSISSRDDSEKSQLVELIHQAQDGCEASAHTLFELCRQPLLCVIRKVIFRRIRTLFDSDDFLLAAFSEIFTHHFRQEVLQSPARFWPYLKRIAENKVHDAHRKHLVSQRSNLRCEVSLEDVRSEKEDFSSSEMSPYDSLVFKELVEERLADLIDQLPKMLQIIIHRLLEGKNTDEIATELGVNPKRVYRAMAWLRKTIMES